MGWSCRVEAGRVTDAWTKACVVQTGSQNTYEYKGVKYFWETSRREHADGAITGTIWQFVGENQCRKVGSFRIEGDGTITRAPKYLMNCVVCDEPRPIFEVLAPRQYSPV